MAAIDIGKLVNDSIAAASAATGDDITKMQGFAKSQFEAIAQNAAGIAEDRLAGKLSKEEFEILMDGIPDLVKNTANCLKGLALIAAEKAWNAIAKTVQDTVSGAVKAAI